MEDIVFKTPDYVRRAKNKYSKQKRLNDPDYAAKLNEAQKRWLDKKATEDPTYIESLKEKCRGYYQEKAANKAREDTTKEILIIQDQLSTEYNMKANEVIGQVTNLLFTDDQAIYKSVKQQFSGVRNKALIYACIGYLIEKSLDFEKSKRFIRQFKVNSELLKFLHI